MQLIISDACRGLMESAAEYLPQARWQRCMVHFYRNVFSHVPATRVREVGHMLKAIHTLWPRQTVGTPSRRGDGRADLYYVRAVAREIAVNLCGFSVVVTKSTVPVGTGDEVERIIQETRPDADFAFCVSNSALMCRTSRAELG